MAALLLAVALIVPVSWADAASDATRPAAAERRQQTFGTKILSGSSWLGGSGVDVFSNGDPLYISNDYSAPAVGMKWQCVELAQRLYTSRGWYTGRFPSVTYARQIWDAAPGMGMSRQANGSISRLVPGDMIVEAGSSTWPAGHVAIVSSVGGSTITAVEQNGSASGLHTYAFRAGALSSGYSAVRGIVHAPGNQPTLPAQPANPRALSSTSSTVTLAWADASTNETSFVTQYRIGSGSWTTGPTTAANTTSTTITGLSPATTYTFQVGARNAAGTKWSAYVSARTATQPTSDYHAGRRVTIDSHASGGVSGHKGPADSYPAGPTRAANSALWIVCYVTGQAITGPYGRTTIWDLSDDGYYYTDAWLYTGSSAAVVPKCAPKRVRVDSHATGGVSGHKGPGDAYASGPTRPANSSLTIVCYVTGTAITGPYGSTTIWDLADDGYYYTDAWLYTGSSGAVVPRC